MKVSPEKKPDRRNQSIMKLNKKFMIVVIIYISRVVIFSALDDIKQKNCPMSSRACSLQIEGKRVECNLTEIENYADLPFSANMSTYNIRKIQREFFEHEDDRLLWADISGEYDGSVISSTAYFLIIFNPPTQPNIGKYYLLTFDSKLVSKEKQMFTIECLQLKKMQSNCTTVLQLIGNKDSSPLDLMTPDKELPECEEHIINLEYLKENEIIKVTLKKDNQAFDNYSVNLWEAEDVFTCEGTLMWNDKINTTEFFIHQKIEDGLRYCIYLVKDGQPEEEKIFTREDLKNRECISRNQLNQWNPQIPVIPVLNDIEVKLIDQSGSNYSHHFKDFQVALYTSEGDFTCKSTKSLTIHSCSRFLPVNFQKEFSAKFENLTYGNYCAVIYPVHHICKGPCTSFCSSTVSIEPIQRFPLQIQSELPDMQQPLNVRTIVLIVIASLYGLLTVGFGFFLAYERFCGAKNKLVQKHNLWNYDCVKAQLQALSNKSPKMRILLLYASETNEMYDLILQFINVLETCFFCTVIHCSNDQDINEIIKKSTSGWISYNIRLADKIILIESQHAYEIQQHWINSKRTDWTRNEDNIFLCGLITIQNKQCEYDYKVTVIRFDSTPSNVKLEHVVEMCRFILPLSLPALFLNIHGENLMINNNAEGLSTELTADALLKFWEKESPTYTTFLQACYRMKLQSSKVSLASLSALQDSNV